MSLILDPMHARLVFTLSALAASSLGAQNADSLPRVVITATRVDAAVASAVSATATMDRAMIERTGVRDLAELLRLVPGVTVARSGGPGSQSSIFLRGGENDYVRVLIDGVPVNDPGGAVDLSWLSLDDIERVEVVRGPASVLYGTDAVTGVIQLFTRRGLAVPLEVAASMGRYGTQSISGTAAAGSSRLNATLAGATERSDGILEFNSGYQRDAYGINLRGTASRETTLDLGLRAVNDEYHFPTDGAGAVVDRNAFRMNRRLTSTGTLVHPIGPRVRGEISISTMDARGRDDDQPDSQADTLGFFRYDAHTSVRRRTADLRAHLMPGGSSVLTLGVEAAREAQRGNDSSNFSLERSRFSASRRNAALYGQWLSDHGPLSLSAGARYDENSTFGSFSTVRAGMSLRTWRGGTVRFTAGTAFKAPTFFESFNSAFSTGNPDLDPERSRGWEAGIAQQSSDGSLAISATWFAQGFRDMIQYAYLSPEQPNYFNVAAASTRGLELEVMSRPVRRLRANASATWLRTRVDDAGLDDGESATFVEGNRLLRRPSVQAGGLLALDLPRSLTADIVYTFTGSRDDRDFATFPATPVVLPSWSRVDLGLTAPLTISPTGLRLTLSVRLGNAFNARYQEIANYPAPGRSLTIGVRAASLRR